MSLVSITRTGIGVAAVAIALAIATPANAQVNVGADWETAAADTATGTLCGSSITISPVNNGGPPTGDFSGSNFSAAPLSATEERLGIVAADEWTATFDQPVSDLLLYCYFFRGASAGGPSPVTYTFNQPFTILSGMAGATINGTTLEVGSGGFYSGIIEFAGPVSTLSVTTSATSTGAGQGMTFGVVVPDVDTDNDGVPDACDQCDGDDATGDTDADGVCDDIDPCPADNPDDTDGDGVCDSVDACPGFDDSLDADNDTVPDACDACEGFDDTLDADGDNIPDDCDNCPNNANAAQLDCDGDGIGDVCELANCNGSLLCQDCNFNGIPDGCENDPSLRRNAVFTTENTITGGFGGTSSVFSVDMDGDTDMDVLSVAWNADDIAWWENNGDGTSWTRHTVVGNFHEATDAVAADFDGDGDLDVAATANTDFVTWWENTSGDGLNWTRHNIDTAFESAQAIATADIDGDGDNDIAAVAFFPAEVAWYENDNGDGSSWTKHVADNTMTGAQGIHLADVDLDGNMDILAAGWGADEIAWYENDSGDGSTWTRHSVATNFQQTRSVFAADMNGDGKMDIVGAANQDRDVAWWENTSPSGDGTTWTRHDVDLEFVGAWSVVAADVDSDGDNDILGAGGSGHEIALFENTAGDGSTWSRSIVANDFKKAWDVVAADVDGDGDLDAFGASFNESQVAWFMNEGGQFGVAPSSTNPTDWAEAQIDDVMELVVTHNGRAGDFDFWLYSLGLRFEHSPGVPMTTAEAQNAYDNVSLYLDDGSGLFEAGSDTLVTDITLSLNAGVQLIDMPLNATTTISAGTPKTYFVVVTLPDPIAGGQGVLGDITYLANQAAATQIDSACDLLQEYPGSDLTATITFADADADGVADSVDACPGFDDNLDADADGVPDDCDNCPGFDDNADADGDGVADGCDPCPADNPDDTDADGVCDSVDLCPGFDDTVDTDNDGIPDGCDICTGNDASGDGDADGICDDIDNCPATPNADQTDGEAPSFSLAPVAAFHFDENAGVSANDVVTGHIGTLSGPTWNAAGRRGSALTFPAGGSTVNVPGSTDFNLVDQMTISMWIKPSGFPVTYHRLLTRPSEHYVLRLQGRKPHFYVKKGGSLTGARANVLVNANQWTHLAAVWDGLGDGVLRIYINGVEAPQYDFQGTVAAPLDTFGNGINLGNAGAERFEGDMDEVGIFDKALSPTEIQGLLAGLGDGVGDACDACAGDDGSGDSDGDGICDDLDPCPTEATGDLNGDGLVNLLDVDALADILVNGHVSCAADVNLDGSVNGLDVQSFVDMLLGV